MGHFPRALAFLLAVQVSLAAHASSFQDGRPPGQFEVTALQIAKGLRVRDAATADLDGDGRADVVVAVDDPGRPFSRTLFVFRARAKGPRFSSSPDLAVPLTPDVVAWTSGDVDPAPGEELVLFTARAVFAWRSSDEAGKGYERLLEADFLWQLPDPHEAWSFAAAVRDLDGDGLEDLAVPEPGGCRIALQRRSAALGAAKASFELAGSPRTPRRQDGVEPLYTAAGRRSAWRGESSEREFDFSLELEGGERTPRALLRVVETCPAPQFLDFDADGRLDLVAQDQRSLLVWLQGRDGRFDTSPRHVFPLPVSADRERRLDASYSAHALELNGDGRADVVIFAGDKRSEDVRTQMLVFEQGAGRGEAAQTNEAPLFGPRGLPQELLVLGGFVVKATFEDVDLDGRPDLVVRAVRPDLIDQIRSASSESIDADVYVYRNEGGLFAKRPDLSWRVNVPIKSFDLTLGFLGDATGDRVSELLVRDKPERLRVLALRRQGDGLSLLETPLFELAVDHDARVEIARRGKQRVADVLVLEGEQVLCVRAP